MRIQHNIAALNSHRQLTSNNSAVAKNLEKLSSGYRINRAGDDAAGLAISEKMRAQITSLNTASKNAQDGISLVQTAEGALTEVHSMLNRMTELAGQAANGTYQDQVDRENAMKELNSLRSEIDRISDGTNFNGIKLLNGNLSTEGTTSTSAVDVSIDIKGAMITNLKDIAATSGTFTSADLADMTSGTVDVNGKISFTIDYTDKDGKAQTKTVELKMKAAADGTNKAQLEGTDGDVYDAGTATATGDTALKIGQLQDAIIAELNKDADFKDSFTVAKDTDALKFTSVAAGTKGATLGNIKYSSEKANGTVTQIGQYVTPTAGKDGYKAVDFGTFTSYDGTNAESSVFTVNGKKFAFVTADVDMEKLKAAGIDDYVKVATDNTVSHAEAADMANRIQNATGIKAETGNITGTNDEIFTSDASAGTTTGTAISFKSGTPATTTTGGGLSLQIGESSDSFNQLTVSVKSMSTKSLGIDAIDIGTQDTAKAAVDKIKTAINTVSSTRGDLGAIQNRLEHTINNLGVTAENMSAAESRIRDVDMAQEMMAFTKNNILTQASQAMLAQANQLPQGVLQLLQ